MAEVSSLHRRYRPEPTVDAFSFVAGEEEEEEPNLYIFDYDYISPPNRPTFYNPPFGDFNFAPNHLSDSESEKSDSDCSESFPNPFFYINEEEVSFVTDLFGSREGPVSGGVGRVFGGGFNGGNVRGELGLGLGREFDAVVLSSESRGFRSSDGLRVVGMGSESDSDDADAHSAISDPNGGSSARECLRFNDQGCFDEEFEWEEVNERDNLSSLIDRIEEISVSSGITSSEGENPISDNGEEEEVGTLEWEVLLAVNNLERQLELENDVLDDEVSYLNIHDDYIYAADHDPLFGQFSDGGLKGSPPAAKYIVENLPSVTMTDENESKVSCAVCKDDILVGEMVNRLPCSHHYHGDCIVPWLNIRNTCPVCRYELPTDDADYEKKKTQRHTNPLNDFEVRYNFEFLP